MDVSLLNISAFAMELKLGPQRIGAHIDGGLQIFLPQDDTRVAWDKSYYEISFEVTSPFSRTDCRRNASSKRNETKIGAKIYPNSELKTPSMQGKYSRIC